MAHGFKFGNTHFFVEDLGPSLPGECEHCGKIRIRYLAHLRQDVADTLNRALDGELTRDDDTIGNLSVAMLAGKESIERKVGCVCVAKFLVDCGVDTAFVEKVQGQITRITNIMKQIAKCENLAKSENVHKSINDWTQVATLRDVLMTHITRWPQWRPLLDDDGHPLSKEDEEKIRVEQGLLRKNYKEASQKWTTKHFGFYTYFDLKLEAKAASLADRLQIYYTKKMTQLQRKLSYFNVAGEIV